MTAPTTQRGEASSGGGIGFFGVLGIPEIQMTAPTTTPPIDPNLANDADADIDRRMDYLRRRLAEGLLSQSARNLIAAELRALEARRAA